MRVPWSPPGSGYEPDPALRLPECFGPSAPPSSPLILVRAQRDAVISTFGSRETQRGGARGHCPFISGRRSSVQGNEVSTLLPHLHRCGGIYSNNL